jgi:hypothetical protein
MRLRKGCRLPALVLSDGVVGRGRFVRLAAPLPNFDGQAVDNCTTLLLVCPFNKIGFVYAISSW